MPRRVEAFLFTLPAPFSSSSFSSSSSSCYTLIFIMNSSVPGVVKVPKHMREWFPLSQPGGEAVIRTASP